MLAPFLIGALGLAWWAYGSGLELAGFHRSEIEQELVQLRERVEVLSVENESLKNQSVQSERLLQIEQSSNQETAKQLKSLSDENLSLQEDLAFFQNLTAVRGKEGELAVHRLKLVRDSLPGEYRLRMLLVQGGQRAKEFSGSYQLVATIVEGGQRTTLLFPQDPSGNAQFQLAFKYYLRVEKSLQLPSGAQLESVQVRIFEQGAREPKVRQSVSLS
ncbi:MAG: hypothetical protein A2061_06350 [Gallionellales bacterium GWA2_59_43]|nr:MAG: hypothetical protein A2061_06350 [Gallionellales bacterium GWA2_59_43]